MKKRTLLLACILLLSLIGTGISSFAGVTYDPSCYSNVHGWSITKIETSLFTTDVHLSCYTYKKDHNFFFQPGMYIENYNAPGGSKYYLKSVTCNGQLLTLGSSYSVNPYQETSFLLHFDKIPESWTDINIHEPAAPQGYTQWHWDYISLNKPSGNRLNIDNFMRSTGIDFLRNFAHPLNTYLQCRYSVDRNSVMATIYYDGYVTDLRIKYDGKLITGLGVVYDNDLIAPFSSLMLLRDWIFKYDSDHEFQSEFEQRFNTTINSMTGEQLACVALTILYNI